LHPRLHIDIDTQPHLIDRVGDTLDAAIALMIDPEPHLHQVQLDQNTVHAMCSRTLADKLGPTPDMAALAEQTFLIHTDMPLSFDAWKGRARLPGAAADRDRPLRFGPADPRGRRAGPSASR
jgi:LysR family glycine cleavage system transcriptional activator